MDYTKHISNKNTHQQDPIPGRDDQVKNNAGGYGFQIDALEQAKRFLILGTEGGTYYVSEHDFTVENAQNVIALAKEDPKALVDLIVDVSENFKAPKNDPAIFALAICASYADTEGRKYALAALPRVCRIGTHLLQFIKFLKEFRSEGRAVRRAISKWFLDKTPDQLGYQAIKYQSRYGMSMRDALRLAHPKPGSAEQDALFKYIVDGFDPAKPDKDNKPRLKDRKEQEAEWQSFLPEQVQAFERIKQEQDNEELVLRLIERHRLPLSCVPTQYKKNPALWSVLLPHMGVTTVIRNLGNMTACGFLKPLSKETKFVTSLLTNSEALHRAKIHPIQVLAALVTYENGGGFRGKNTWEPIGTIVKALNQAFHMTFDNVEPTGKNFLIGLDVSSSMTLDLISGVPGMTPRVASAAMSLVTVATEPNCEVVAFSDQLIPFPIHGNESLETVMERAYDMPFGGTDCALPMLHAVRAGLDVDAFMILTDNETWAGSPHPCQALQQYRRFASKPDAKLIVVGMAATEFSIADPQDPGMLDVVGFDTSVPTLINNFVRD